MIDFSNAKYFKLKKVEDSDVESLVSPILVSGERIVSAYKTVRDHVVFTNKRVIAVSVQGLTGTKRDFTSMPYSKIQVYSVETAGLGEKLKGVTGDCELQLYFSSVGMVNFEFNRNEDIKELCRAISEYVL